MNRKVILPILLTLILLLSMVPLSVLAEDTYGVEFSISPSEVKAGEEVEVTIALTGYTTEAATANAIRGFQIDINDVDESTLTVVEHETLIEDTTATSNKTSYQSNKKLVRLVYLQMNGTLAAPCEAVMKVKFQVSADLTESGSITLPVTAKIQLADNQKLTLEKELVIPYTVKEKPEEIGVKHTISPSEVKAGEEVDVTIALTGYTAATAAENEIRGLQVDITNVDTSILEVVDHQSLIMDAAAASNTTSYQSSKKLVRLLYAQYSGTLAAPCKEVMQIKFRVKSDLTKSGSITLPVTTKISMTGGKSLTLTSEIVITYKVDETEVTSVEIVWGAMEFTYTDGTWNSTKHSYEGGGWTDSGSGYVTLNNVGTTDAVATLTYQPKRSEVTGSFVDTAGQAVSTVSLGTGKNAKVYLRLSGRPSETLDKAVLGSVTVRIGEE